MGRTTEQLSILQPGLQDLRGAMEQLRSRKVPFNEAVVLLVNGQGLTWNAASDRLRGAEAITGICLDRDVSTEADPKRMSANDMRKAAGTVNPADPDAMFCQICTQPIPEKRKTRATSVCSEKCKNKLDGIRARQRATRKCHACLHPSTPEERAEFRQWRANRGDLKSAKIIVRDYTLPEKTEMANQLKSVKLMLEHERDAAQLSLQMLEVGPLEGIPGGKENALALQAKIEKFSAKIRDLSYLVDRRPA